MPHLWKCIVFKRSRKSLKIIYGLLYITYIKITMRTEQRVKSRYMMVSLIFMMVKILESKESLLGLML